MLSYPKFSMGQVLKADQLNDLYACVTQLGELTNTTIAGHIWLRGTILSSESLNQLLRDIESIYQNIGQPKPLWSFNFFHNGMVLKAEHLNEVVREIQKLEALTS